MFYQLFVPILTQLSTTPIEDPILLKIIGWLIGCFSGILSMFGVVIWYGYRRIINTLDKHGITINEMCAMVEVEKAQRESIEYSCPLKHGVVKAELLEFLIQKEK